MFQITGHEYNEYVIGYVINTTKGGINAQFDKCFSNHPQPDYVLKIGCEGDETADILSEEERVQVIDYIRNNSEMDRIERLYTDAIYNGMPFQCPLDLSQIEYWADQHGE